LLTRLPQILLVTHGAFLHYFTEDWDGFSPSIGSAYHNCEVREFTFTPESKEGKAHLKETAWSQQNRSHLPEKSKTVVEVEEVEAAKPAL
jgi:hypothetical protein